MNSARILRLAVVLGLGGLAAGPSSGAAPGEWIDPERASNSVAIAELILRTEYPIVKHVKWGVCYVAFGYNQAARRWNDPPAELLKRLSDLNLKILNASAAPAKQTGDKPIPVFSVVFKEWIGEDEALVEISRRGGMLNADGFTIRLKKSADRWRVVERSDYWSS
jgi:hypothetical protein